MSESAPVDHLKTLLDLIFKAPAASLASISNPVLKTALDLVGKQTGGDTVRATNLSKAELAIQMAHIYEQALLIDNLQEWISKAESAEAELEGQLDDKDRDAKNEALQQTYQTLFKIMEEAAAEADQSLAQANEESRQAHLKAFISKLDTRLSTLKDERAQLASQLEQSLTDLTSVATENLKQEQQHLDNISALLDEPADKIPEGQTDNNMQRWRTMAQALAKFMPAEVSESSANTDKQQVQNSAQSSETTKQKMLRLVKKDLMLKRHKALHDACEKETDISDLIGIAAKDLYPNYDRQAFKTKLLACNGSMATMLGQECGMQPEHYESIKKFTSLNAEINPQLSGGFEPVIKALVAAGRFKKALKDKKAEINQVVSSLNDAKNEAGYPAAVILADNSIGQTVVSGLGHAAKPKPKPNHH